MYLDIRCSWWHCSTLAWWRVHFANFSSQERSADHLVRRSSQSRRGLVTGQWCVGKKSGHARQLWFSLDNKVNLKSQPKIISIWSRTHKTQRVGTPYSAPLIPPYKLDRSNHSSEVANIPKAVYWRIWANLTAIDPWNQANMRILVIDIIPFREKS